MTPRQRLWIFLVAGVGFLAFYLWGLIELPGFGHYPGPYGDIINAIAVPQTHATGVVSAVNFEYRAFDTLGEEFILFIAATGVATVLRHLREERDTSAVDEAKSRDAPATSDALAMVTLAFIGPTIVVGWYLASHAQTSPSGGFQGGIVFKRLSPDALTDAIEAIGAGSFAAVGIAALALGAAYLTNILPLGNTPGAVNSAGTIALISFFVGVEVAAAFILIIGELLEQTLIVRGGDR
jgi:multicomponent Na+:H+ antiporter subunit B